MSDTEETSRERELSRAFREERDARLRLESRLEQLEEQLAALTAQAATKAVYPTVPAQEEQAASGSGGVPAVSTTPSAGGSGSRPTGALASRAGPSLLLATGGERFEGASPDGWPTEGLPTRVKLDPLQPLAHKGKEGMTFHRWKGFTRGAVAAAGLEHVLDFQPPLASAPEAVHTFYRAATGVLYSALLLAVRGIQVLEGQLLRLADDPQLQPQRAYQAWRAIHLFFVRESSSRQGVLQRQLGALAPGDTESMEQFLERAERLREEYALYSVVLPDRDLVVQVLLRLTHPWRVAVSRLTGEDAEAASWPALREALQREDTDRRASSLSGPDAQFPLGWTPQRPAGGGGGRGGGGAPPAQQRPGGGPRALPAAGEPGAPATGSAPGRGRGGAGRGGGRVGAPGRGSGLQRPFVPLESRPPIWVCWGCHGGHKWTACKDYDPNRRFTQAEKDAAKALLDQRQAHRAMQVERDRPGGSATGSALGATRVPSQPGGGTAPEGASQGSESAGLSSLPSI